MPSLPHPPFILLRSKTTGPFVFFLRLFHASHPTVGCVLFSVLLSSFGFWSFYCDTCPNSALRRDSLTVTFLKVRNLNTYNSGDSLESRLRNPKPNHTITRSLCVSSLPHISSLAFNLADRVYLVPHSNLHHSVR
jgi:hypothetical protein